MCLSPVTRLRQRLHKCHQLPPVAASLRHHLERCRTVFESLIYHGDRLEYIISEKSINNYVKKIASSYNIPNSS